MKRALAWLARWISGLAADMERFDREYAVYSAARARGMSHREAVAILEVLDG